MNPTSFVIGRFQPFHKGHLALIQKALSVSKRVVVFIGSSNSERTDRNPFSVLERLSFFSPCFTDRELKRISFVPLPDFEDDKDWLTHIEQCLFSFSPSEQLFTFVCCDKDSSTSYYNSIVSNLSFVDTYTTHTTNQFNATDIRLALRNKILASGVDGVIPSTAPLIDLYRKNIKGIAYEQQTTENDSQLSSGSE